MSFFLLQRTSLFNIPLVLGFYTQKCIHLRSPCGFWLVLEGGTEGFYLLEEEHSGMNSMCRQQGLWSENRHSLVSESA